MSESDVDDLVGRADALTDLGRNREAIDMLMAALLSAPEHDRALSLLAYAHFHERGYEAALDTAKSAVAANPELEMPHRIAALALLAMGKPAEALDWVEQAVGLAPDSWLTHVAHAHVLKAAGRYREALAVARRAVALGPDEPDAQLAYADVAAELNMVESAEDAYRRALQLRPHDAVARHDLAVLQMRSRRYADAVAGFAGAAADDPSLRVIRDNLITLAWRAVASVGAAMTVVLGLVTVVAAAEGVLTLLPSRSAAAAAALSFTGMAAFGWVRTPRSLRPFARSLRRGSPWLVGAALCVAGVAAAQAGYAVWPARLMLVLAWLAVAGAIGMAVVDRLRAGHTQMD